MKCLKEFYDIEFFVNRRDFPVIKRNSTEPYDDMFGHNHPLISHQYDQYSPILSMVTTDEHADITIPTGEDWSRIRSKDLVSQKQRLFVFINKPAGQSAGQTLPDATPPLGKIPMFTKITVTFDPIKRCRCPFRFGYSLKMKHSLFYD